MLKKIFTSVFIFIIVFALVSISADLYYHSEVAHKDPANKGWICYSDFRVFWYAAHNIHRHIRNKDLDVGEYPVYDKSQEFYHFRYSPFVAFIMIPFGIIPYPATSLFVWYALLNLLFLSALFLMTRELRSDFNIKDERQYIILWGVFLGTLRFYLMNISLGQTDILIAFLFVLFLIAYLKEKEIICGIILGLILQFKLPFLLMLVYFLLIGKKRLIISTCLAFVTFLFIPASLLGFNKTVALLGAWKEILGVSVPSQILNYKNQSVIYGIGMLLLKIESLKKAISPLYLFYALSIVLTVSTYIITALFRKMREGQNRREFKYLEVSILIIATLLFSPITWEAYFISLVIPLSAAIFFTLKSSKRKTLYAALGVFFILSCVIGTDLTKFVPIINKVRFINISLGTLFLAFTAVYSYKKWVESK